MVEVPSLFSLCLKTMSTAIINEYDHVLDIFELPSIVLDSLMMSLPPIALQNIDEISLNSCGRREFTTNSMKDGRKRGRLDVNMYDSLNAAWKTLYKKRWPEDIKRIQPTNCTKTQYGLGVCNYVNEDWQQLYWEAHLQNCLDAAAERAVLPAFDGHIGVLEISDKIMKLIGYCGDASHDSSKLWYHCNQFGRYARYLRLQNVLCVAEICELLKTSKLQGLVFRRIISKTHVNGVCMLLNQNRDSLLSIEFIYCQLSPTSVNQICSSVYQEGTQSHGIHHLYLRSSLIFDSKSSSIPAGLLSFLSAGRSLKSLCFCDTYMGSKFAEIIFDTLLESSCGLVSLDISDNEIAGWLPKNARRSTGFTPLGFDVSLKSLCVLNIRGNNLRKDDAKDLTNVLFQMPSLKSLDISDNPIGDDGIRSLIPYFVKALGKADPISDIKIDNCNLSSTGVTEFLRGLPVSEEPLNALSIGDNELGSYVAASLAKFLGTSRVRVLNIEDIGLGPVGFQEFEKELPKEVNLLGINISKNRGGIRAAHFVAELISRAPNISSINAGYNLMPPESLLVIQDALKQLKGKLRQLDLTGNTSLLPSVHTSNILDFQNGGKSIVTIPSFPSSSSPYDDDP